MPFYNIRKESKMPKKQPCLARCKSAQMYISALDVNEQVSLKKRLKAKRSEKYPFGTAAFP